MDDHRIENALRQGPPDEPAYVPGGQNPAADTVTGATGPAAFEGRIERRTIRTRRQAPAGAASGIGRGIGRRLGWALPLAAVVTFAVVGLSVRFVLGPGASPTPAPDLLTRIRADGVIRIAVSNEAPQTPTSGGAYSGFDVDVASALATALGLRVELHLMSPDSILRGEGTWELALPSHALPNDLVRAVAGPRYYLWPAWLVVRTESPAGSVADLGGARICVVVDSPGAAWLAGAPIGDATTIEEPADAACLSAIASGAADAAVTANLLDIDFALRGVRVIGGGPAVTAYRSILIRASPELGDPSSLQAALDAAVTDLRATGQLAELSRRAFGGEDLTGAVP